MDLGCWWNDERSGLGEHSGLPVAVHSFRSHCPRAIFAGYMGIVRLGPKNSRRRNEACLDHGLGGGLPSPAICLIRRCMFTVCHISTTLPFSKRSMAVPAYSMRLPVAGMPPNSPECVPR